MKIPWLSSMRAAESPYSRGLYPPGSNCTGSPGTKPDFSEDSNSPPTLLVGAKIDSSIFPLNKTLGCTPVYVPLGPAIFLQCCSCTRGCMTDNESHATALM